MRITSVAAVLLGLSTCSIGQQVRAPVNVAFDLYSGCMSAAINNARVESTPAGVREWVRQTDFNCETWMKIWYPALMGDRPKIEDWDRDTRNRLEVRQKELVTGLEAYLLAQIKK